MVYYEKYFAYNSAAEPGIKKVQFMYAGIMQSWFSVYCKNSWTENMMKYLWSDDGYIHIPVFSDPFLAKN